MARNAQPTGQGKNGTGKRRTRKASLPPSVSKTHPTLIVIGGREDEIGDALILREVARHVGTGKLVVTDVASSDPDGIFEEYDEVFRKIGVQDVQNLEVRSRKHASDPKVLRVLDGATAVFFTGGDQLKITSQIGGTPVFDRILEIYRKGGVIAGTSAGASVVCGTMLTAGSGQTSPRLG